MDTAPRDRDVLYSCVVDATPVLYHQVMVWAWTAVALADIAPAQLLVHLVDGCDPRLRRDLEALGVRCVSVRGFGAGTPMCNKLVQLESPALAGRERLVLSDCDLAWCAPIAATAFGDRPRAKVVDFANPPFELLAPLFAEAGFPAARTTTVSIGGDLTFHNNCNGGLYLLSSEWLRRLREPWPRWLAWVEARADRLGRWAIHMFQVAFALALEELGTAVDHLPLAANVPTHSPAVAACAISGEIGALHFHRAFDTDGELASTGHPHVDAAIARVNDLIRVRRADAWWLEPETVVLDGIHGRFATRPRDHVTRQLEAFGAHTRNEIAMVLAFLRPGDRVLDVGAHIGAFTVPFARAVGTAGRVVAVEPDPHSFALLQRNVGLNGLADRVEPHRALVTDDTATYRPVATPDHTSATHYLRADDDGRPGPACRRLDSFAATFGPRHPLRLVKIDVEGMELAVLRSGAALFDAYRPLVYVEVVAAQLARYGTTVADVERFLIERGYALFRNVGERNSRSDDFRIARLARLADGGEFFDCLAVPADRVAAEPALRSLPGSAARPRTSAVRRTLGRIFGRGP